MPQGPSADGKGWVNFTHSCPKCQEHLPLPKWQGTHCPKCGTKQPIYDPKISDGVIEERKLLVCAKCLEEIESKWNYCKHCGHKLKSGSTITKA